VKQDVLSKAAETQRVNERLHYRAGSTNTSLWKDLPLGTIECATRHLFKQNSSASTKQSNSDVVDNTNNTNTNTNTNDNVYGAVILARSLPEFTRFI